MVKVTNPKNKKDIREILNVMKKPLEYNPDEVYGIWKDSECLGGMIVTNKGELDFLVNSKHGVSIGLGVYKIFKIIVPKYIQLLAKVDKKNKESIKICTQVGFRKAYEKDGFLHLVFSKELWAYQQRWEL